MLAYLRHWQDETLLCVANLARDPQPVALDLSRYRGLVPLELSGRTQFPGIGEEHYLLSLPGYGFYWFQLVQTEEQMAPVRPQSAEPVPVLVWFDGWRSLDSRAVANGRRELAARVVSQFENQALGRWLPAQRWYTGKGRAPQRVRYRPLRSADAEEAAWSWGTVLVDDEREYLLPLAVAWDEDGTSRVTRSDPHCVAPVRRHARMGELVDAAADRVSCGRSGRRSGRRWRETARRAAVLRCRPRPAMADIAVDVSWDDVEMPGEIGTNTTVRIGDWGFLKLYRGLQSGVSVEVEMGEFLTERAGFTHAVPVLASAELVAGGGRRIVARRCVRRVRESSRRDAAGAGAASGQRLGPGGGPPAPAHPARRQSRWRPATTSAIRSHLLGQRTGEMHQALQSVTGDPAFDPEPVETDDLAIWADGIAREADQSFDLLAEHFDGLAGHERHVAERLLSARRDIVERVRGWQGSAEGVEKTRFHGDYHLGQVLVRRKTSSSSTSRASPRAASRSGAASTVLLKDVAGMLRSFDYAAFTAAFQSLEPSGRSPLDLTLRIGELREWACARFLEGYGDAATGRRPRSTSALVELFVWEKAFYELRYELRTRPQWAMIPLHGLERYFLAPDV